MSFLPPNAQTFDILDVLYRVTVQHTHAIASITLVAPFVFAALSIPHARRISTPRSFSKVWQTTPTPELFLALAREWAAFLALGLTFGFLIMLGTSVFLDWTNYMLPTASRAWLWEAIMKDYEGHFVLGCVAFVLGIIAMSAACFEGIRRQFRRKEELTCVKGGEKVDDRSEYPDEKREETEVLVEEV
jgi:hypothetical protein